MGNLLVIVSVNASTFRMHDERCNVRRLPRLGGEGNNTWHNRVDGKGWKGNARTMVHSKGSGTWHD